METGDNAADQFRPLALSIFWAEQPKHSRYPASGWSLRRRYQPQFARKRQCGRYLGRSPLIALTLASLGNLPNENFK
jgi:hypothetical protein